MLELQDGRKIVISLSAYRSPKSVSNQPALEGVVDLGMASLSNEGQIISWAFECNGVVGSVAIEIGSEGKAWDSNKGLLNWEHLSEPLVMAPSAMDNSVVTEIPLMEDIGCTTDIDNTKLSQWITNRIKAFQKSVGTSLDRKSVV